MNWSDFASPKITIGHADMATLNKVRAWARRNNATVNVSRYAKDAYEGSVTVHTTAMEAKSATDTKVAALKALLR